MDLKDKIWQSEYLSRRYLEGVRSAIPLAEYQIEVVLYIIRKAKPKMKSFLDLGCGDGILGRALLSKYPSASGVFVDFLDSMSRPQKEKLQRIIINWHS